jgi:DNA-binding response OmpR family regulator
MKVPTSVMHTDSLRPDVMLVEDDDGFAQEMSEYLQNHGLTSTRIAQLDNLAEQIRRASPRVVLLDQFISGNDALMMLPQLRNGYAGGLVVLTANRDETDRIVALELGADDFIVKNQPPREILARVRAVMRRSAQSNPSPEYQDVPVDETTPARASWLIDLSRRALFAPDGTQVHLTSTEFELLAYLSARTGQTAPRAELYAAILRRPAYGSDDRAIDNLVSRVRAALAPFLPRHNPIKSMRGVGYIFVGLEPGQPGG